jgi:hypothetical protein
MALNSRSGLLRHGGALFRSQLTDLGLVEQPQVFDLQGLRTLHGAETLGHPAVERHHVLMGRHVAETGLLEGFDDGDFVLERAL